MLCIHCGGPFVWGNGEIGPRSEPLRQRIGHDEPRFDEKEWAVGSPSYSPHHRFRPEHRVVEFNFDKPMQDHRGHSREKFRQAVTLTSIFWKKDALLARRRKLCPSKWRLFANYLSAGPKRQKISTPEIGIGIDVMVKRRRLSPMIKGGKRATKLSVRSSHPTQR